MFLFQCTPFWPENSESKLLIRIENSDVPPKIIQLDKQENCLLLHLDNRVKSILLLVTETSGGQSTFLQGQLH